MAEHGRTTQPVKVFIPDCKVQKCIVLDMAGTVWAAKQVILDKIYKELPRDSYNYSLYMPASGTGKLGKYMDDFLLLTDYTFQGTLPRIEMRYKSRDYTKLVNLTDKNITKANSKANQRKLVENIIANKKINKLLESGLDPNFVTEDGNTPLGIACGRGRSVLCIQSLLLGGAHIDFRGKDGLTPMHRAAIGGNALAINTLLLYGASPNYRDQKGLTPVYHSAIMGDDPGACHMLLRNRAELGTKDQGGWSEMHHTSKYGHVDHAELFIRYGANINDQNLVGNTPLHVAASHGQTECAMMLLKRGADKTMANFSGQTPSQVSILCGHHQLASEINSFSEEQVELLTLRPEYNENARNFASQVHRTPDSCLVGPPMKSIADTLTRDWEDDKEEKKTPQSQRVKSLFNMRRPSSASSHGSSHRLPPDTESLNSVDFDSVHSDSTGAPGTPGPATPISRKPSFGQQRERLYRAGPGEYVAIQDMEPQQPGDIPLRKGMAVEVTYIGKGGYWEGRAGGQEGWFPRLAIKEAGEEEYDDYPPTIPVTPHTPSSMKSDNTQTSSQTTTNLKEIVIRRGNSGYGFAMRGVRATKAMQFQPSPEVPALQYVGSVEQGGAAAEAGLMSGDFIIEVNGQNVTHSTHDEVVVIVKKGGDSLRLKVITSSAKPKSVSNHLLKQITPLSTPEPSKKRTTQTDSPQVSKAKPKPILSTMSSEIIDRETIIGETSIGRTNSPYLPPTDWDSSQDEHEEAPIHILSIPTSGPKSSFSMKSFSRETQQPQPILDTRSQTLPVLPAKDYPSLDEFKEQESTDEYSDANQSDENTDNISAFQLALQKKKQVINRKSWQQSPDQRSRAQTLPSKTAPPKKTNESSSNMSQQILQASKERLQRADSNTLRMSPRSSPKPPAKDLWTRAMKLLNEPVLTIVDTEDSSSEVEQSSPLTTQLKKNKIPPVTKPKPKKDLTKNTPAPKSPLLLNRQAQPISEESVELPKPLPSSDSLDFDLPPPLMSEENHPNSFVDLAPPMEFNTNTTEVDSIRDDYIPPPLPQTSPPPTLPTSSESEVFLFPSELTSITTPPMATSSPLDIPPPRTSDQLPSPMPSPTSVGNSLLDMSSSVVPPPAFSEPSPWSPDSDDTPPPVPLDAPPPLELDEDSDSEQVMGSYNIHTEEDVDTPPPRPPLPAAMPSPSPTHMFEENSIAPVPSEPTPMTGFTESPLPKHTIVSEDPGNQEKCLTEGGEHKTTPLAEWGVEEVSEWLRDIGLGEYVESFADNEIVGEHLMELNKEELKELGIKKIGHYKKFQSKVSSLLK